MKDKSDRRLQVYVEVDSTPTLPRERCPIQDCRCVEVRRAGERLEGAIAFIETLTLEDPVAPENGQLFELLPPWRRDH